MIFEKDIIKDFQNFIQEGRGYIPDTSGEVWTRSKQNKLAEENKTVAKYGAQWIGKKVDDCSGAFVDSYRKHGLKIYHGSNRIAREYIIELVPIDDANPGYAAFKVRKPGDNGYSLPDEYKQGGDCYNGDLNDYYHIGMIDDDGRSVINAQSVSKGFTRTDIKLWHCAARLKAVVYNGDAERKDDGAMAEEPLYRATVTAESGKTVRLRTGPSTNAWVAQEVPIGTEVEVLDVLNGWCKIRLENGKTGYMMGKFLRELGGNEEPAAGDLISRSALLAAYDASHEGPPGNARRLIEDAPAVEDMVPKAEYEALAQRLKKIAFALME